MASASVASEASEPPPQSNTSAAAYPGSPRSSDQFEEQGGILEEATDVAKERDPVLAAHITSLRLLFTAWLSHFNSLGYIKESTMDSLDKSVLRRILQLSVKDHKAREAMGTSFLVWSDILALLRLAIPSLESRTYATIPDPYDTTPNSTATIYDGPSSNIIVIHHASLLRDLQRLNNLLSISRNILTAGAAAQNLAAQHSIDREVCCLVNLCVKITARGYDGDGTAADEEKWQAVVNEFKKLLITCLQVLSNLVTLNERLKLMLWVELFDSASEGNVPAWPDPAAAVRPPPHLTPQEAEEAWASSAAGQLALGSQQFMRQSKDYQEEVDLPSASPAYSAISPGEQSRTPRHNSAISETLPISPPPWREWMEEHRTFLTDYFQAYHARHPTDQELEDHIRRFFEDAALAAGTGQHVGNQEDANATGSTASSDEHTDKPAEVDDINSREAKLASILRQVTSRARVSAPEGVEVDSPRNGELPTEEQVDVDDPNAAPADALNRYMGTAQDGIRKLEEGKRELMKRLDSHPIATRRSSQQAASPESPLETPVFPVEDQPRNGERSDLPAQTPTASGAATLDSVKDDDEQDEEDDAEESSEDDYDRIPGEDGRGLLTDVPLILGPNEIEVLPMIIMSGIVTDSAQLSAKRKESEEQYQVFLNMYTIRCHLLLAQEMGRNLLRELLIFVAAWDLREEELYFKFMVKIMESILMHGLMPFAYGAFKENKDIISPAQAVIMKLLTKIFHSRQAFVLGGEEALPQPLNGIPKDPTRVVVGHLFSEFRNNIIPQICALIFLQGQIRAGRASIEDFPLNLWDMERMYEGVYQYLEFFAILTDHDEWKALMTDWEVVSELVTLLRELDAGIGKKTVVRDKGHPTEQHEQRLKETEFHGHLDGEQSGDKLPPPVAVERPYSPLQSAAKQTSTINKNQHPVPARPPTPSSLSVHLSGSSAHSASASPPLHEEPADFEWRNLKKLCVLVLSSLVWKNKPLQDQVLKFGGIETILKCCAHDEHNPYIREHAIMCLRFCVEGNEEIRDLLKDVVTKGSNAESPVGVSATPDTTIFRRDGVDIDLSAGDADVHLQTHGPDTLHVPPEVLDAHGYETFMDKNGQVGLRRKEISASASSALGSRVSNDIGIALPNANWAGISDSGGRYPDIAASPGVSPPSDSPEGIKSGSRKASLSSMLPESEKDSLSSLAALPRPRTAAELPQWIEAITRDLPHRQAELKARLDKQASGTIS